MDKYGALIFLFTFAVNLLLLRGAAQGDRSGASRIRAAIAAPFGAGYALFCLRLPQRLAAKTYWILPVLLIMGAVAFGVRPGGIGRWLKFVFLWLVANAMAVGAADMDGWFLILAAALLCLLALMGTDGGRGSEVVNVVIQHGGETVRLRALRDNGNLLRDPVTGERVLIVSPRVGWELLGLTPKQLMDPVATVASGEVAGLRLIPYSAVGHNAGLLPAMRFSSVMIDGQISSRIVAFAPNPIGEGQRFEALAGGIT